MPPSADFMGPILELMTWVCFVPGVPLGIAGLFIARKRCPWSQTSGEVVLAGTYKAVQWTPEDDAASRLVLLPLGEAANVALGTVIDISYDTCHPARWSLHPTRHYNPILILGWILTGVGILCTIAGLVLMAFSSCEHRRGQRPNRMTLPPR